MKDPKNTLPASIVATAFSSAAFQILWDDGEFVLSRGVMNGETSPFLTITPTSDKPGPDTIARLNRSFAIREELDSAWAIKPLELVLHRTPPILVLDDPGGETLARLTGSPWETETFLRVAIGMARTLGQLHKRGLIHKNLKPANVLVRTETGEVWLTGFDFSSRLTRERQSSESTGPVDGMLAYMAPEQSGRMNRSIDSRTDLYACGVIFYLMLTGHLPFNGSDAMEWIHCHVARQPIPPHERVNGVPAVLSEVVMKLLSKNAEGRYQTAAGLEADLRKSLAGLSDRGVIELFALGEHDVSDRLLIPEKLYGRERAVETLTAAFARAVDNGTPEWIVVSGYSGIGKSSVVNELHRMLVPPQGLFAAGKFDQYRRDVPYATLAQAFQSLIRMVLGKPESELSRWRVQFRDALGENGQLMVNLIPELELVIGKQPPARDLPHEAERNRFQRVFRRFAGVFAKPEHPLVVFLDDLQWLDPGTLDLIKHLLDPGELRHILLVGAYRDNEVTPDHPLMRTLVAIRESGVHVGELVLGPLQLDDVTQLVADGLHCEKERAESLARLIYEKTAGNPFFTIQFLGNLAEEGLIGFDPNAMNWQWDLAQIRVKSHTDNVVELMVGKMNRLPAATREALTHLACLGHRAETAMLRMIYGESEESLHSSLWEAVRAGLVLRMDEVYAFLHDRVREAAYTLIPETKRAAAHLQIGRALLAHTADEKVEETVFEIVNHFEQAGSLVLTPEERIRVAELNLLAGKRARAATAYASALKYFTASEKMLADDAWKQNYETAFAVAFHRAECEFLTGQLRAAEEQLAALSCRATGLVDQAAVTCLQSAIYTTQDRPDRVFDVCLGHLRKAGIDWSLHPTDEVIRQEYRRLQEQIGDRSIESLVDLPLLDDSKWQSSMNVLMALEPSAKFNDGNLHTLLTLRMANLSLEHGNSDETCMAYAQLSMVVGPCFGDNQAGFRFGQLGFDLVEQRGFTRNKPRVYLIFAYHVLPWIRPLRDSYLLMERAVETAHACGDLTFAAFGVAHLISLRLALGNPLGEVQQEAEAGLAQMCKAQYGLIVDCLTGQLVLIWAIRGQPPNFGLRKDTIADLASFERHLETNPRLAVGAWMYWIRKLQLSCQQGEYELALEAEAKARQLPWTKSTFQEVAEYHFWGALAHAAVHDSAATSERPSHLEAIRAHHQRLVSYEENCPDNFTDRVALVAAEIARIEGRELDAEKLYECAIRSSRERGLVQHEGLSSELAGRFHAMRGLHTIAHACLQNARYCYLKWDAHEKVKQLDRQFPSLSKESASGPGETFTGASVRQLDLAAVIKASQSLSGEIVLNSLVENLLRITVEHAGADRGALVLPRENDFQIEAEATSARGQVEIKLQRAALSSGKLPVSLIQYVARTGETVIADDALTDNQVSGDEYVRNQRPRSLLCLPLLKQARLVGIVYLENRLASFVFTPDKVGVLRLLASQAAISLENARLYAALRDAQARMAHAERLSLTGSWTWHIPSGEISWSDEAYRIWGLDRTVTPTLEKLRRSVHPDDLAFYDRLAEQGISDGKDSEFELRLIMPSGQVKYVQVVRQAVNDDKGQLTRYVGAIRDVTSEKLAFRQIQDLKEALQNENIVLREQVDSVSMFEEIIGTSPALQTVLARVAKVAPTDSTVLITGETGTGKELIARAIHKRSPRADKPFISINCAAIPSSLIASELFGHEKGAFTGALQRRLGRFELAQGGTLFLDEFGELPAEIQVSLLRVLQEREFERVGGTQRIRADVRLIAATNRDLKAAIIAGTFRSDLFYRLNVFPIEVPPLRARKEDIPMLAEYFIHRYAVKLGKRVVGIDKKTLELFRSYPWPGNIRELQNIIERSLIVCETDTFSVDESWLPREPMEVGQMGQSFSRRLESDERNIIEAALRETFGRVSGPSGAAARLGMPASTLESKIRALKINKHQFKSSLITQ